jgi:hypothetical protein
MIFRKILFFFFLFTGISGFSQTTLTSDTSKSDTLLFLNGEVRAVKVVDTAYHLVRFLPKKGTKKPKVMDVEKDRVFSIKFSDGQERILYYHDTSIGNVFTVLEAKMFMLGEREAEISYSNKWPFIIGFATGALSPLVFPNAVALSPIAPALTPLHTRIPVIKINIHKIQNKHYLQYDTYLMGYEKVARKKNFINTAIGAGLGFAIGLGTWAIPDKTWSKIGINVAPTTANNLTWKDFLRKNRLYFVWAGQVGCVIGASVFVHKRKEKKHKNEANY